MAVRIEGEVEIKALGRTLSRIVERHEVLRTRLVMSGGEPRQVIDLAEPRQVSVVDLEGLGEKAEKTARRLAEAESLRPFDLGRGPMLRALLLRLSASEHVLVLTTHHVASDGWSVGILLQEFFQLYESCKQQPAQPAALLLELPVQYADYAAWQREWLQGEVLERGLSYWKQQLADLTPLQLPVDFAATAEPARAAGVHAFQIDRELTGLVEKLARREGATTFMVLLSALQAVLARWCSQSDIVLGTVSANRDRVEIEPLIGFFVNTLLIRTHVKPELKVRQLIRDVRETMLTAYAHQEIPYDKVVEELPVEGAADPKGLFRVLITSLNAMRPAYHPGGFELLSLSERQAKFDLTISLSSAAGELISGEIEYAKDIFAAGTIGRLASALQTVLRQMTATPDMRIDNLKWMQGDEEARVLLLAEGPRREFTGATVDAMIARQALERPSAAAVVFEEKQLTYRQLEDAAARLARHLQSLGVGTESPVGLCLQRSEEIIVAILAVLKAGGAYVPLDPAHPVDRLQMMIRQSGVQLVVCHRATLAKTTSLEAPVLCIDEHLEIAEPAASELKPPVKDGQRLSSYILHTSGSTGRPKGAAISHNALTNYVRNIIQLLGLPAGYFLCSYLDFVRGPGQHSTVSRSVLRRRPAFDLRGARPRRSPAGGIFREVCDRLHEDHSGPSPRIAG